MSGPAPSFTIIPAQPGYRVVYSEDDGSLFVAEDVIAWRVETEMLGESLRSDVYPVSTNGEAPSNWIGLQHPNGQVSLTQDQTYDSLEEAIEARKLGRT